MDLAETTLKTPDYFPFPFSPYPIQIEFMKNLYEALEQKKLGIFESPTGTGKSMSLICASLKWLTDAEERVKQDVDSSLKKLDSDLRNQKLGDDWLAAHTSLIKIKRKKDSLQSFQSKITRFERRIDDLKVKGNQLKALIPNKSSIRGKKTREPNQRKENMKNPPVIDKNKEEEEEDDDDDDFDILLNEPNGDITSYNTSSSDSDPEECDQDKYNGLKIFLASRTHTQLDQLLKEIEKSPFGNLNVRVVSLASRQNYCVNDSVLHLKILSQINEKCQDLRNKKNSKTTKTSALGKSLKRQKTTAGCPYYNSSNIEKLRVKVLNETMDIEDIVGVGKKLTACPYYACRNGIKDAQVILLTYNTLLHKGTRQACGIDLKNSVVIIDEAHNLLDAIENIHSSSVTGHELSVCHCQLTQYSEKYGDKFSPSTVLRLNQLIFIINKLLQRLGKKPRNDPTASTKNKVGKTVEKLSDFLMATEIDTINFFKVLEFASQSNITNKLRGFADRYQTTSQGNEKGISAFLKSLSAKTEPQKEEEKYEDVNKGNPLFNILHFIESLTNNGENGRIVCNLGETTESSSLKFLMLNPAAHFTDIINDARSVVLVGGTMHPVSEFKDQLFNLATKDHDRVKVFSCDHIIPKDHILPIVVQKGPSGQVFNFTYPSRNSEEMLSELGRLLINISAIVPAGIVCFFQSYEYENCVFNYLKANDVITKLRLRKRILREPKQSSEVASVLKEYQQAVCEKGAMLFCVIGGKLHEGVNFSDDLGRCVVIVGMPFPNNKDIEFLTKMDFYNSTVNETVGRLYYKNVCMKAVNQSIGRSIRHKSDYASVLLVDCRYSKPYINDDLPRWIKFSLRIEERFGSVCKVLAKFFADKKSFESTGLQAQKAEPKLVANRT